MKLKRERVRYARDRLGWSLRMVGEKAGTNAATVLRAEHGHEIRPSTARKIACALGVEVADLVPDGPA
jgi:transcriptional regulator with XRE-family HTH domain